MPIPMPDYVRWVLAVILAASTVLLYFSATLEWWVMEVHDLHSNRWSWLHIYAYGLVHNMSELRQFVTRHETPPPLMAAAQAFTMGLVVLTGAAAVLVALRKGWVWKITLSIGLVYLFYSLAFIPVLEEGTRTAPRPVPMQGDIIEFMYEYTVRIITYFAPGYYLAVASSILLIALSLVLLWWSRRAAPAGSQP